MILLTGLSSWGQHKFQNSDQLTWDRIFNYEQCNSFYPLQKYKETKSTSLLLLQRKTKLKDNNKILILHIAIYPTRREEAAAAAVSLILITYKQCDYTGTGHRLVSLVWETDSGLTGFHLAWTLLFKSSFSLLRKSTRDWRMLIMAWALIISSFNVSLSTEILWISLCKSLINFLQLGDIDESRLAASSAGGGTRGFSLGSRGSIRENSSKADIAVVVAEVVAIIISADVVAAVVVVDEQGSWLVLVEFSEAFERLDPVSLLCFLLLYWRRVKGASVFSTHSGGQSSTLSVLHTGKAFWESPGTSVIPRGLLLMEWLSCNKQVTLFIAKCCCLKYKIKFQEITCWLL